jgi:uncharacterized protein
MSEQENTRVVQDAYQNMQKGDARAFLNLLANEVEWRLPAMEQVPFAGAWHGRQGVEKFFGAVAASQEMMEFQPDQFIAQGDTVVVLGCFVMRVKATGRISRSDWAHVWTLKRGEVAVFREYVDTAAVSAAHRSA